MLDDRPDRLEDRVLLLAPTAKDAAVAGQVFASIGIRGQVCDDLDAICREIARGAGAAIVPDEALLNDRGGRLARLLADQPPWSAFPLIVLTPLHDGAEPGTSPAREDIGPVTLVRRPVEIATLASTIRTALRDRRRQYATRDYLLERERQAEALRASEERFRAIFREATVGFAQAELDGRHLTVNARYCSLVGRSQEELRGLRMEDVTHADDRPHGLDALRRLAAGGPPYIVEQRFVRPDGSHRWAMNSVILLRDNAGHPAFIVAVVQDITDRKLAEQDRDRLLRDAEAARAEAEAANRMKDDFLATLSHELRTPLNAILGWARILRSGRVDQSDVEEGLAAIERNSTAQAQIIEDLLDISRIVSGNFRLEVQRVNIQEVIEAALLGVKPAVTAKEIRVHKVLDSLAGPVSGDPARLQQVIWNLLSNAVKFTPKGGQVQVLLERVNSHNEISVIDTGMGIRPDFLPHIFDRFRQADASTTRRHGGLGLGLAIVKQLVEMHGGTVRAKSPGEGQGSTFTVMLPITVVHPEQSRKARPEEPPATAFDCKDGDLEGVRVLVVDDEPDARKLIERVLVECGAEVAVAGSAVEALQLLESFRPSVLVSDIGMPDQDGYDLLRTIRGSGRTPTELPAAALTAFAGSEDRKRALLAGFQTHVVKPVDPSELLAVVASLAGRTGSS